MCVLCLEAAAVLLGSLCMYVVTGDTVDAGRWAYIK